MPRTWKTNSETKNKFVAKTQSRKPTVSKITVKREYDEDPMLDFLGHFSDDPTAKSEFVSTEDDEIEDLKHQLKAFGIKNISGIPIIRKGFE